MTKSAGTGEAMPVVVIVDPSLAHRAPLRAAILLAQSLGTDVEAIVVRNHDYEALASLPFTRELRVSSSQWGEFRRIEVVSGFGGQLRRIEQMIAELSRSFDTSIAMRQVSGRISTVSARMQALGAIVMVDRAPMVPVHQRRQYRQVVAVQTDDPGALEVAAVLAHRHQAMLRILIAGTKADGFAASRDSAIQVLGDQAPHAHWLWQVIATDPLVACDQIMSRLANLTAHTQSLVVLAGGAADCPEPAQLRQLSAATVVTVPAGLEIQPS